MQVTQVADHVTHAVIGGEEAIDFGISQSAEFFHILSSTLYTDQKLAVVRETVCNAWDAHVDAGITDTPLQITLLNNELIIKDFGKGIPRELIGQIYGTYGGSTKKNDGKQTGGFGLGCKSPFAYTDHFEVTSCCNGEMTIYKLSKSSAEVGGKPSIQPVVTLPTIETGITVKIEIQNAHIMEFRSLIRRIVRNGEMNVIFNDEKVEGLPFSTAPHNFLILAKASNVTNSNSRVLVRYGHVIYPVDVNPQYAANYEKACRIMDGMCGRYESGNYRLVLQAPPHSITVTPSRESLSMQEYTINTLTGLLNDFVLLVETKLEAESYRTLYESIDRTIQEKKFGNLLTQTSIIPGLKTVERNEETFVGDTDKIALHTVSNAYPNYVGFHQTDMLHRIDGLLAAAWGDKSLLIKYRRHIQTAKDAVGRWSDGNDKGGWFKRTVLRPLIAKITSTPEMDLNRTFMAGYGIGGSGHYYASDNEPISLTKCTGLPADNYFTFMRKIVVIAHSKQNFRDRVAKFPFMVQNGYRADNMVLYVVARSEKKVEAARAFWKRMQYNVVDLTLWHDWEEKPVVVKRAAPKPKKVGFPKMSSALSTNGTMRLERLKEDYVSYEDKDWKADRIEIPQWFSTLPRKKKDGYDQEFDGMDRTLSFLLVKHYGDVGAAVVTQVQQDKLHDAGACKALDFVMQKVEAEMLNNPLIQAYLPFARWLHCADRDNTRTSHALSLVYEIPELRKEFGIGPELPDAEKGIIAMYRNIVSNAYRYDRKFLGLKAFIAKINAIPASPDLVKAIEAVNDNTLLAVLDVSEIVSLLGRKDPKHTVENDKVMTIVKTALNI